MEKYINIKPNIFTGIGILGSIIIGLLGGWDTGLQTLLIFMATDYFMGLAVAGVFHKSKKTESGALQSNVGWRGLCKKGVTLLVIMVGAQLDILMDINFVRNGLIIAFISNELISIMENAGLMGVDMPPIINKALDMLQEKEEDYSE